MIMPIIHTAIPYHPGDLGHAYNEVMSRVTDKHWVCFIDHDAIFTTSGWYMQLCNAINTYEDAGIFTCLTNRIGCGWQKSPGAPSDHDMTKHREHGYSMAGLHGYGAVDKTDSQLLSGVLMCLSRNTWGLMGGFKSGFLGVDNQAHRDVARIGKKVYLLPGLYVYHWYRGP